MRIRKHAKKIAAILSHSSSGVSTHTLLRCQLNQSPWDVMTFPPADSSSHQPPFQVDGDDSFAGNGSFGDSIGAVESVASMKICEDNFSKRENIQEDTMNNDDDDEQVVGGDREITFCCKTDGKDWHCQSEAKIGHSMCDHHLDQLRNYNVLAHPVTRNPEITTPTTAVRRRGRPKKAASSQSSPHEFYYYSGFGPRWGKKRGTQKEKTEAHEDEEDQIGNGGFDYDEDYEDEDDDDDDHGDINGEMGKKRRVRKPIKARSLKSLM